MVDKLDHLQLSRELRKGDIAIKLELPPGREISAHYAAQVFRSKLSRAFHPSRFPRRVEWPPRRLAIAASPLCETHQHLEPSLRLSGRRVNRFQKTILSVCSCVLQLKIAATLAPAISTHGRFCNVPCRDLAHGPIPGWVQPLVTPID